MMTKLAVVLALVLGTSPLTGCSVAGAVIGSQITTGKVHPQRMKDGRVVNVEENHAVAGLVVGGVVDALVIGAAIAVSNFTLFPSTPADSGHSSGCESASGLCF